MYLLKSCLKTFQSTSNREDNRNKERQSNSLIICKYHLANGFDILWRTPIDPDDRILPWNTSKCIYRSERSRQEYIRGTGLKAKNRISFMPFDRFVDNIPNIGHLHFLGRFRWNKTFKRGRRARDWSTCVDPYFIRLKFEGQSRFLRRLIQHGHGQTFDGWGQWLMPVSYTHLSIVWFTWTTFKQKIHCWRSGSG